MKYTIEGLQQQILVDLGLDCLDAVILSYLYKFYSSGEMITSTGKDGCEYFWMSYQKVLDDLPILRMGKRAIALRFKKYIDKEIMYSGLRRGIDNYTEKGEQKTRYGAYTYFRFNDDLIEDLIQRLPQRDQCDDDDDF